MSRMCSKFYDYDFVMDGGGVKADGFWRELDEQKRKVKRQVPKIFID